LILSVLVLLVLAGHLPGLASTLEDLDSFNFALGLRDFDPRKHQPHPPGYPVIIALAISPDPSPRRSAHRPVLPPTRGPSRW